MLPPEYRPILWHDTVQVLPEPEVVSVYLITVVDFFFFFAPRLNRTLCKDTPFSIHFKYASCNASLFPGFAGGKNSLICDSQRGQGGFFASPGIRPAGGPQKQGAGQAQSHTELEYPVKGSSTEPVRLG